MTRSRRCGGPARARAGWLNLNVHFHSLVPDGVFDLAGDGPARFVELRCPTDEELTAILTRIIRRAARVLASLDDDEDAEADPLAALQAAEVDRRLRSPDPFRNPRHSVSLRAAIAYTVLGSCQLADVDPVEYLADVLPRLARRVQICDMPNLLPARWKAAREAR